MSKKKQLEKVQQEQREQQEQHKIQEEKSDLYQKSSRVGMLVGLLFCAILIVIKLLCRQPWQDAGIVYGAIFSGRYFCQWARQRNASSLIFAIFWGAVAAVLLTLYLIAIL